MKQAPGGIPFFSAEHPGRRMARVLRSVNNALTVPGKSTIHRLLTSLAARGYVRKNPETVAAGRGAIRELAAPFLRSLMLASKETVHLGVLDECDVVDIDS